MCQRQVYFFTQYVLAITGLSGLCAWGCFSGMVLSRSASNSPSIPRVCGLNGILIQPMHLSADMCFERCEGWWWGCWWGNNCVLDRCHFKDLPDMSNAAYCWLVHAILDMQNENSLSNDVVEPFRKLRKNQLIRPPAPHTRNRRYSAPMVTDQDFTQHAFQQTGHYSARDEQIG